MPTVQQIHQYIVQTLKDIYAEPEAGAMGQLILEHVLQKSRVQLSLSQQEELNAPDTEKVKQVVERLLKHEPIQYVLGVAHFYDLELQVDERVLIPRPETEELVHMVVKDYKNRQHLQIMDICTGSGCIPLALASNLHTARVYGLEVSEGALQVARANAAKYRLAIEWLHQDIFEQVKGGQANSLDIITSNPPYVLEEEKQHMRTNVLAYEPELALFVPDTDPLKYYKRIGQVAFELLREEGKLYFEINERYGEAVRDDLLQTGFKRAEVVQDLFGKDRIVWAVR